VFFVLSVKNSLEEGLTNHDYFLSFSIAGGGDFFFVKNTGRGVVWVEKRCSRMSVSYELFAILQLLRACLREL